MGFPISSISKESAFISGDLGSLPGFGGSPGEVNSYSIMYSCLENLMDRGAWWVESTTRVGLQGDQTSQSLKKKKNQLLILNGSTYDEAEALILWPYDGKSQLIGKDPNSGKD